MAVNMNFCTMMLHKCRDGNIEVTQFESKVKDLMILWYNRAFEYES